MEAVSPHLSCLDERDSFGFCGGSTAGESEMTFDRVFAEILSV